MKKLKAESNHTLISSFLSAMEINQYKLSKLTNIRRDWIYQWNRAERLHPYLIFKLFELWCSSGKSPSQFFALCKRLKPGDWDKYKADPTIPD